MTSREFMFFFMGLGFGGVVRGLAAGREKRRPASEDAERARSVQPARVAVVACLFFAYAAVVAGLDLWLVYRLSFLQHPWGPIQLLIITGIAAFAALSAWIGLRLLHDKDLPGRCARAWRSFLASAPDGAKLKSPRHAHDLD